VRFSLPWLRDYVDLPEGPEEIGRVLTSIGFAVEGLDEVEGDAVLDLEITTNRPDAMCHVGLARELAVKLGRAFRPPSQRGLRETDAKSSDALAVEIAAAEDCFWFTARVVRGVTVGPSPDWLARRLRSIGLQPINNVVDVTNYVLWETGQPLHAFDFGKLTARASDGRPRIVVRRAAAAGESLRTLDGTARTLDARSLVIADERGAVGLGGVMGGEDEKVSEETRDIALEAAAFDAKVVRQTAKLAGLHTDASHRFERGSDRAAPAWASARAAALIAEIAGGSICSGIAEARGAEHVGERPWGTVERARLVRFAGFDIAAQEIVSTLTGLGFDVVEAADAGPEVWRATPPSWRENDFLPSTIEPTPAWGAIEEADLFEEVLRQVGLDRVPSHLPAIAGRDAGDEREHERRGLVRSVLAGAGLAEAVTYSFLSRAEDQRFAPSIGGEPLELENPISEGYQVLRRSVLGTLIDAAHFNLRRGADAVRLFEAGKAYSTLGETEIVAILVGGATGNAWQGRVHLGFPELKGIVEGLFDVFGRAARWNPATARGWVAGATAEILIDGRRVGLAGRLDDADAPFELHAAELELDALGFSGVSRVAPPARFPGIAVDTTVEHARAFPWAALADEVAAHRPADLAEFGLKDRFDGEGVAAGRVRTTLWFHYQAADRSLTQDEVNERHAALTARLAARIAEDRP
jgi:phenylalanyl-tRNA synthetase beta chain